MAQTESVPYSWLQQITMALQWPVIVVAAFWLGRVISKLEGRVIVAEKNVSDLVERHMPHLYNALAEIRGLLMGNKG